MNLSLLGEPKYAVLEFFADEDNDAGVKKPSVSIVPWCWVEEEEKLCWWPPTESHSSLANKIRSQAPVKPGFTQQPFSSVIRKCCKYLSISPGITSEARSAFSALSALCSEETPR